jgi:hypothetical protein
MSDFNEWIDTFLAEKQIDLEQNLYVEGESGLNIIPVGVVVCAMKETSSTEQAGIQSTLAVIDFKNSDPLHFVKHIAQALAC